MAVNIAQTKSIGGQGKGSESENGKDEGSSHGNIFGGIVILKL